MSINADALIQAMIDREASDLYLTVGTPASLRKGDSIFHFSEHKLTPEEIRSLMQAFVSPEIIDEFDSTLEYNTAVNWQGKVRLRINLFRQRQQSGIVIRRIQTQIPSISELGLPSIYHNLVMEKRGLILIVGPTGSGKSTSLAAMLEHRNQHGSGHIVTIEDPIEFVIEHKRCIVTQRDVGIDTYSFGIGLKNALRQTPDVIVIGEVRDRDTMEHAISFAETGHLCLATLHANNANQAIERIVNFFPEEKHTQVLLNLSLNLKAVLSQRLLPNLKGTRSIVIEILLNQGLIRSLIQENRIKEIKECMEKNRDMGMQSFDQALIDMCIQRLITEDVAIAESDNPANLRLALKQHSIGSHAQGASPFRTINTDLGIINKQQF